MRLTRNRTFIPFSRRTNAERNAMGQFFTPENLASEIADLVFEIRHKSNDKIKLLEPAFGTGSLYDALRKRIPCSMWECAWGIEKDPSVARLARRHKHHDLIRITCSDFTKLEPSEKCRPNLIVANPPYVRHQHLSNREKRRLGSLIESRIGLQVSELAGLYCYFLLLADGWLEESGLGVWLIPSEFMEVNYGTVLRKYLSQRVSLLRVHRFDPNEVQFSDALVSSSIVVFKKETPCPRHEIDFTQGGSLSSPRLIKKVPLKHLVEYAKWNGQIWERPGLNHKSLVLSDLFEIKRGIATGCNEFFVISDSDVKKIGIPRRFLQPLLPSPRNIEEEVIERDSKFEPVTKKNSYLLNCRLPENVVKQRYRSLWNYLQLGLKRKVNRRYLTSSRDPWYIQEKRQPAPFLCNYMGRKSFNRSPFRFFWNKSDAIATNVYLMLYPNEQLSKLLEKKPLLFPIVLQSLQSINPKLLVNSGRVYGGGLYKIEPSELGAVAVPTFSRIFPTDNSVFSDGIPSIIN
jgi:adenine-specific DNA-methyltransferase